MVLKNYQTFIEMTSNMIYIVALGGGFKCPRKIPQCPTHAVPPMVEIGLSDLPKYGGYHGTPCTPGSDRPVQLCLGIMLSKRSLFSMYKRLQQLRCMYLVIASKNSYMLYLKK